MGSAFAAAGGWRAGSVGARTTGIFFVVIVAIVGAGQKTARPSVPPVQMLSAKAKAGRRAQDGQSKETRDYSCGLHHRASPVYEGWNDRQAFSIHEMVRRDDGAENC